MIGRQSKHASLHREMRITAFIDRAASRVGVAKVSALPGLQRIGLTPAGPVTVIRRSRKHDWKVLAPEVSIWGDVWFCHMARSITMSSPSQRASYRP